MDRYKGIKQILEEYKQHKADIEDIEVKIQELESIEDLGPQAIDYAKDKICQTYKFSSETEDIAVRIADEVTLLKLEKIHKESLMRKIDNAINTLDEIDRQIIRLRHLSDKKVEWYKVTSTVHMSDTQCRVRGKRALKELEDKLCNESK